MRPFVHQVSTTGTAVGPSLPTGVVGAVAGAVIGVEVGAVVSAHGRGGGGGRRYWDQGGMECLMINVSLTVKAASIISQ